MAQSPVPESAKLEKLATGFKQPEGPVWIDSMGLLFSDIKANKIYRWSPSDSSLTTYLYPSDSSNGLTLDLHGRLILTQMAKRRIARQETDGTIIPLASTYNGKKFNSPNDLVVKSDGSIFFTDPDFNTPWGQKKEIGFKGVFKISPDNIIKVLDSTTFDKPNGICFSPDESKLYVNESPLGKIYIWDVVNDSTIANKKLLYTIPLGGYADGMKVDPDGNIYCTGPSGVWIISPAGVCLDTILMENPSNCAWGDADRKSLYITAGKSLYRIRLAGTSDVKDQGFLPAGRFELYNNYPNPFNPATRITYIIPPFLSAYQGERKKKGSFVLLKIYDILGREIVTLVDGTKSPGTHTVEWNGKNSAGQQVGSGVYYYRFKASQYLETKKMLLIK